MDAPDLTSVREQYYREAVEKGDPNPDLGWETIEAVLHKQLPAGPPPIDEQETVIKETEPSLFAKRRARLLEISCDDEIIQQYATHFNLELGPLIEAVDRRKKQLLSPSPSEEEDLLPEALLTIPLETSATVIKDIQFTYNQRDISELFPSKKEKNIQKAEDLQSKSTQLCSDLEQATPSHLPSALHHFIHQMERVRKEAKQIIMKNWRSLLATK